MNALNGSQNKESVESIVKEGGEFQEVFKILEEGRHNLSQLEVKLIYTYLLIFMLCPVKCKKFLLWYRIVSAKILTMWSKLAKFPSFPSLWQCYYTTINESYLSDEFVFLVIDPDMPGDLGKYFVVHCRRKPTLHKNRDVNSTTSPAKSLEFIIFLFEPSESPWSYKVCFEASHRHGYTRSFSCEGSSEVIWFYLKVPFLTTKQTWQ